MNQFVYCSLLSFIVMFRSAVKLYAWRLARSKLVKDVLMYLSLSQDFFLSFFFFLVSCKKDMYKSFSVPSGVDSVLRKAVRRALWSVIPPFWALIPVIFWVLSPEPIYHVTTHAKMRLTRKCLWRLNRLVISTSVSTKIWIENRESQVFHC